MGFREVVLIGLDRNTGKCWMGEAIHDGFDDEHHSVCLCHAWMQSLSMLSL